MNKKKGSAMVLAILLLSFFMALSLNMWFISQKKAQRAGDKVIGNKVLTDIDGSSTLGYYEFYLATEYMNKGFVTSTSAIGGYVLPTSTAIYGISGVPTTTTIEGIHLENEKQYFGSYLSSSGAFTTSANAILNRDEIVSGKLSSRDWTVTGGAVVSELWESTNWGTQESFGGYEIERLEMNNSVQVSKAEMDNFLLGILDLAPVKIEVTYFKDVYFDTSNNLKNNDISYKITVSRVINTVKNGLILDRNYTSDDINEIIVTKQ